jgi:LemA protein
MKRALIGCGVVAIAVAAILALAMVGSYNRLVTLEEGVEAAWSQVENVYQRRADLIPNLVEAVRGARDFERETLVQVVEARARVGQVGSQGVPDAQELQRFEAAQGELSTALSRLLVIVERYPELRATEAFRDLMGQLESSENRIAVERRRFNEAARELNTTRRRFPTNLIAGLFGFEAKPYFASSAGAETPPPVLFD